MPSAKNRDKKYIHLCNVLAEAAVTAGDNPFGCVIVMGDKVIVQAKNQISKNDVTQHAEIVAMRKAQKLLRTSDLSDCAIYSNCEPCPMCAFMIRELKFQKVVFAIRSPYMGGLSRWNILKDKGLLKFKPIFSKPPKIISGVLKKEAQAAFTKAFEKRGWKPIY